MSEDLLDLRIGNATVRQNLDRAVASGKLSAAADSRFILRPPPPDDFLQVKSLGKRGCRVLNTFLFRHAYAGKAVPHGCRACYKVKIVLPHLRALVALRGVLEDAPYTSKCGLDLSNPHSRDIYAGFVYADGLDGARAAYRDLRARLDAHPNLGGGIVALIKRGCSNYEAACGPSDRWTFDDGLAAVEEALIPRVVDKPSATADYRQRKMLAMTKWIKLAFQIKDDTYLDFTGGRPLYAPSVSYSVEE